MFFQLFRALQKGLLLCYNNNKHNGGCWNVIGHYKK
jgi:hypothetical protein